MRKNNRPFIFLVCLVISSSLWLANSLGKKYETVVDIPVTYTNLPINKVFINEPPKKFEIKMIASGYLLLKHKFQLSFSHINFNLRDFSYNRDELTSEAKYVYYTDRYLQQIAKQISSGVTILDIYPDTLIFQFDNVIEAQKIIKHNFVLEFDNQYFLDDSVRFSPQWATVTGPKSIIDTLNHVNTIPLRFKQLNNTQLRTVKIAKIKGVEIVPDKVEATVPVSQYTEFIAKVPILKTNVPEGINLVTFPGNVEINCLVSISDYKAINPSAFSVVIDYQDIINNGSKQLTLKLIKFPEKAKNIKLQPQKVEYIIEK